MSSFEKLYGKTASDCKTKSSSIPASIIPAPTVTMVQFIELLQKDLDLEYKAAIQYFQHSAVIKGAKFEAIKQHLNDHGYDEIGHAKTLNDYIDRLGGTPAYSPDVIRISSIPEEFIKFDMEDEQTAVNRYKERTVQALSLGQLGFADELLDILKSEEEHLNDDQSFLGIESASAYKMENPVSQNIRTVDIVTGTPYISENPILEELNKGREQRIQEVMTKLASLKK